MAEGCPGQVQFTRDEALAGTTRSGITVSIENNEWRIDNVTGSGAGDANCIGSTPPTSGDWIISNTTICQHGGITLNGNLTIMPLANLTFENVTFVFNTSGIQYRTLNNSGTFVVNLSNITVTNESINSNHVFRFFTSSGAYLSLRNSIITHAGDGTGDNPTRLGAGVNIQGNHSFIQNNQIVAANISVMSAMYLYAVKNITVLNNSIITYRLSSSDAIRGMQSTRINITGNTLISAYRGIYFDSDSPENYVIANTIVSVNMGVNFYGYDTTGYVTIANNFIISNTSAGIRLDDVDASNITNNVVLSTDDSGIVLADGSSSNNVSANAIATNGVNSNYGIYLWSTCNANEVGGNSINTSGTSSWNVGLYLEGSTQNYILNNNIRTGGTTNNIGIVVSTSHYNRLYTNILTTNGSSTDNYGIYILGSAHHNNLTNNSVTTISNSTSNIGLYISSGYVTSVIGDRLETNGLSGSHGILIDAVSYNNTFMRVQVLTKNVSSYGIYLRNTSSNRPQNNTFIDVLINATMADDVRVELGNTSRMNYFVNVTFNVTNVSFGDGVYPSGQLNVSWYTRAFVNATNQTAVQYANVTLNSTSGTYWNSFTDSNGYTNWSVTQGYIQNNSGIFSSNNYTVNVAHPSFTAYLSQQNVTESMTINVTMQTMSASSTCLAIAASGSYNLTNNVSSTGTCMAINASNVVLDCAGYTISYGSSGSGKGVYVTQDDGSLITNVTIRNCILLKDSAGAGSDNTGIAFTNVTNGSIQHTRIQTNGTSYNLGIYLYGSQYITIHNNTIRTNGSGVENDGISLETLSSYNTIVNTVISTSGTSSNYGLELIDSQFTTIANMTIVADGSGTNTLGILFQGSSWNTVTGGTIQTLASASPVVSFLGNASNNNLTSVSMTSSNAGSYGIALRNTSTNRPTNNLFTYVVITATGADDINYEAGSESVVNQLVNVTFNASNVSFVGDPSGQLNVSWYTRVFVNTSIQSSLFGATVTAASVAGVRSWNNLTDSNGYTAWFVTPGYLQNNSGIFTSQNHTFNATYAGLTTVRTSINVTESMTVNLTFVESSCMNITSSGNYLLYMNVTSATTCMNVDASNVVLDCAGYTINYGTGGRAIGVNISGSGTLNNITVKNCIIIKTIGGGTSNYGIQFKTARNVTAYNNTIITNGTTSNFGIALDTVTQGIIQQNNIRTYGTTNNRGVSLITSSTISVDANIIVANGTSSSMAGIYQTGGSGVNITYNAIRTSGTDSNAGVVTDSSASGTRILFNNITGGGSGADMTGVYLASGSGHNVTGNLINASTPSGAGYGVRISSASSNFLSNNVIFASGSQPIGLSVDISNSNRVIGGSITTNGLADAYGIYLSYAVLNNTFDGITVQTINKTSFGIYLQNSTTNRPSNNTFMNIVLNVTLADDVRIDVGNNSVINHFINVTFNQTNVSFIGAESGQLNVSWYTRAFVNATNQTVVQNANVTLNSTLGSRWNAFTDSSGFTNWSVTQGYIQNNSGIFSSNNYTVNATHPSFTAYQSQQNVTESMTINVTMQAIAASTIYTAPTDSFSATLTANGSVSGVLTNGATYTQAQNVTFHNGSRRFVRFLGLFNESSVDFTTLIIQNVSGKIAVNKTGVTGIAAAHTLYLPLNSYYLTVCPGANTTDQVAEGCPGQVQFTRDEASAGTTRSGITVSIENNEWRIDNVTGSGAGDANCIGSTPPTSGDWIIANTTICQHGGITLNGNLTILPTANLTFENVTFIFNTSIANMTLNNSGNFYVNYSNVTVMNNSINAQDNFRFFTEVSGYLKLQNSMVLHAGIGSVPYGGGITVLASHSVIRNVTVITANLSTFSWGIVIENAINVSAVENTIIATGYSGVRAEAIGLLVYNGTFANISGNTISVIGKVYDYGIYINGSTSNSTIASNIINLNTAWGASSGISVQQSTQNNITGNAINVSDYDDSGDLIGIDLAVNAQNNRVRGNTIRINATGSSGSYYGMDIGTEAVNNSVDNNNINIFSVADDTVGIVISTSSGTNITYNNITISSSGTQNFGISTYFSSPLTVVFGNRITSGQQGVGSSFTGVSLSSASGNSTVSQNYINVSGTNNVDGVYILASEVNITNNTIIVSSSGVSNDGLTIQVSNENYISGGVITTYGNMSHGLTVKSNSDYNSISGITIQTFNITSYGIYLQNSSTSRPDNNTFINVFINATKADDVRIETGNNSVINYFINVTFNQTNVSFGTPQSGRLDVAWYTRAFVNATNMTNVSSANVSLFTNANAVEWSNFTDALGYTSWLPTTEYIANNSGRYYETNYTVNVTHPSFVAYLSQQNVTESMTINISLSRESTPPSIQYVGQTPANASTQSTTSIYVNVSASDANDIYGFTDFDHSLVGWWRMDNNGPGENATRVNDWSGNGYNGNGSGNAQPHFSGRFGSAFLFDGSLDFISLPNLPAQTIRTEVSYSAWFNAQAFTTGRSMILMLGASVDTDAGAYLSIPSSASIRFVLGNGSARDTNDITVSALQTNTWYHIVAVGNLTEKRIYLDGVFVGNDTVSLGGTFNNSNPFYSRIGEWAGSTGFNGSIDEVIIFNRSLSQNEINALYNASAPRFVNNYTGLGEGSHTFQSYAVDAAGNKNDTGMRTVTIQTTVSAVNLTTNSTNASVPWTVNASYLITVGNNGTAAGTFNLSVNNLNSASVAALNASQITLAAGTIGTAMLYVGNTASGDFNATVTAMFSTDASVNVTTGVMTTTAYLDCQNIVSSGSYVLMRNVTSTGTCMNINVSNVMLDCNRYTIAYGTTGHGYGVNVSSSSALSNISVKNCNIQKQGDTGAENVGVNFESVSDSVIMNNTIFVNGTTDGYGVSIYAGSSNNITNNSIILFGSGFSHFGISLVTTTLNNILNNSINVTGD